MPHTNHRKIGDFYEAKALQYLKNQGLKLITKNFRSRFGEIDLILLEQETLVFVEVRYRKHASHGNALESIQAGKQQKIYRTAEYFLCTHKEHQKRYCRFDALTIDQENIQWVKNIITGCG